MIKVWSIKLWFKIKFHIFEKKYIFSNNFGGGGIYTKVKLVFLFYKTFFVVFEIFIIIIIIKVIKTRFIKGLLGVFWSTVIPQVFCGFTNKWPNMALLYSTKKRSFQDNTPLAHFVRHCQKKRKKRVPLPPTVVDW